MKFRAKLSDVHLSHSAKSSLCSHAIYNWTAWAHALECENRILDLSCYFTHCPADSSVRTKTQATAKPTVCVLLNTPTCQPYMPSPKSIVTGINLLVRGRYDSNFKGVIFKRIIQKSSVSTCCEIVPRWMPQNLTDENLTFVQVKAWCRQATSHYLRQLWPRFMSLYGRRY